MQVANAQSFTIKDPRGETHQINGNPSLLTLPDTLSEISVGKTGGERWQPDKVQFRVGGKSYPASERRSFQELGIMPGDVIELVGS